MAIEDIIWAKNRHMFGGIEPPDVKSFKAVQGLKDGKHVVKLIVELPDDLIIPSDLNTSGYDASICTIGGVIIRKGLDGYPKDEFDGELIADIPIDNQPKEGYVVDENVNDDIIYYYRAFVYSTQGIWRSSLTAEGKIINYEYYFGYDLDTTNSDPEERVIYPIDVDNYGWTQAVLNNLNDWNITPGTKFMPRPCMLKYDGTVGEYLDPNDYTKTIYGLNSNVANVSYEANAMMEWPKIYTKRWEENGIYHFRCSNVKIDDDYECWSNYDVNGTEIDHFYTAIYYSSIPSGEKHRSISGLDPKTNQMYSTSVTGSKANGDGWGTEYSVDHFLVQDLLVMIGKSTNVQSVFGYGDAASANRSGQSNTSGLFSGSTVNTVTCVKVFGMEDYWGYLSRRLDMKAIISGTEAYLSILVKNQSHSIPVSSYVNGYLTEMSTQPFGRIPYNGESGSSSTYECDLFAINNSYTNTPRMEIGGGVKVKNSTDITALCHENGPFRYRCFRDEETWNLENVVGSRLSYK